MYIPMTSSAFENFECVGTDPFWKLKVEKHSFVFIQPNFSTLTMRSVPPEKTENLPIEHIRSFHTEANGSSVLIIIQQQDCISIGSNYKYIYEGLVIMKHKILHGCCVKFLSNT